MPTSLVLQSLLDLLLFLRERLADYGEESGHVLEEGELLFEVVSHLARLKAGLEVGCKLMHLKQHLRVYVVGLAVLESLGYVLAKDVVMFRRHLLEEVDDVENRDENRV